MTALIIIAVVLAVLLFLLLSDLRVKIIYDGKLFLRVGFLCFFYTVVPNKKKKQSKEKASKSDKENVPDSFERLKKERGLSGAISDVIDVFKNVIDKFKTILKHLRINPFFVKIDVGSEDAALTAIEYGAVCSVVYPFAGLLSSETKLKDPRIIINADYDNNIANIEFKIGFKIRLIFLIFAATKFFFSYTTEKFFAEKNKTQHKSKGV